MISPSKGTLPYQIAPSALYLVDITIKPAMGLPFPYLQSFGNCKARPEMIFTQATFTSEDHPR